MKTLEEEKENSEMNNGIKEERLKAMKGNYQKPEIYDFMCQYNVNSNCSDMASQPYSCCNNTGCALSVCSTYDSCWGKCTCDSKQYF